MTASFPFSPDGQDRRLNRERRARAEAEHLLETKAKELYDANQRLIAAQGELEALVQQRTAELQEALARTAAMAEARSRFLAVISHEIRTPISGLIGLLDLVDATADGAERDGYLNAARSASSHLLDLVNDVLDLAKIDAGKLVIVPQRFSPSDLINTTAALLRPMLARRPVSLSAELGPRVPDELVGDSHRLRQILLNFASNAVKFTEQGEVAIRLSVADADPGLLRLRIEVEDTGPGIPLDQQAQLFDEFIQADLVRHREIKGTGLGLAICKRLAEAMGGHVGLRSAPGAGSCFWVDVPVTPAAPAEPGVVMAPVERAPRAILLAEDTPTLQIVVASILRKAGHQVTVASNGIEALEALAAARFDVAIMDMFMPGLDGDEVVRRLRAGEVGAPDLPVIMLTAAVDEESVARMEKAGANTLLPKPVQRDELLAAVDAVFVP